jgi:hypothetical protein
MTIFPPYGHDEIYRQDEFVYISSIAHFILFPVPVIMS